MRLKYRRAVGRYQVSENVSILKFYKNIHVHIAYCHCAKDLIKNRTHKDVNFAI